jgi:hypothetical protein
LVEKLQLISPYLTRFLYNARISYVTARTRRDFGSSRFGLKDLSSNRFGLVEELSLKPLVKLIRTL